MSSITTRWPSIFALGLLLVGCATAEPDTGIGAACPTPEADTVLHVDEEDGMCLLVPETHRAIALDDGGTAFVAGDLLNVSDPRLTVAVTEAEGETTQDAAARLLATFGLPDTSPPMPVTLGGQDALVLDRLPGQDINRRVVAVHDDRLYDLTFSPVGPDDGEVGQRTEALYDLVLRSFTFLP